MFTTLFKIVPSDFHKAIFVALIIIVFVDVIDEGRRRGIPCRSCARKGCVLKLWSSPNVRIDRRRLSEVLHGRWMGRFDKAGRIGHEFFFFFFWREVVVDSLKG